VPDNQLAPPVLGRRTAVCAPLAGLAANLVAAGCDNGDEIEPPRGGGGTSATAEPSEEAARTPDEELVDEVLAGLTGALAVLSRSRRAPQLRTTVSPIIGAHRRHVQVLEGELAEPGPPGPVRDPAASLRLVRRSERALHATLVEAAGRAESGALARLLASMSASVSQHLTLLPTEVGS
jgi:hypothetical protein